MEGQTMRWFGANWGAPVCDPTKHAPTPTAPCARCGKPFVEGDRGIILPFHGLPTDPPELPYHHECLMEELGLYPRIHILYHGFPLCRFSAEVPGKWPTGHKWVDLRERDQATCPACKLEAK